jgi:mono/diheme cytochrome c family protein
MPLYKSSQSRKSSLISRAVIVAAGLGLALAGSGWAQTPWTAPVSEKSKKGPIAASAKVAEQGDRIAKVNCGSSHGTGGKGDGAAALALNPKPADRTSKRVQDESDGELFWKTTSGRAAMPSWKHLLENDRAHPARPHAQEWVDCTR